MRIPNPFRRNPFRRPIARRWAAAALLALCVTGNAAAAPAPIEALRKQVASRMSEAQRLAAAGKPVPALARLETARDSVRVALRRAEAVGAVTRRDPRYNEEMKRLVERLRKRAGGRKLPPDERHKLLLEYEAGRKEIAAKYGAKPRPADAATQHQRDAEQAALLLLLADLDDRSVPIHVQLQRQRAADAARQDALTNRMKAHSLRGEQAAADQAAAKLAALPGADSGAFATAGEYFQSRKQFAKAAGIWEAGIRGLEANTIPPHGSRGAAATRAHEQGQLVIFYRQLSFCQQQLGHAAEAKRSLEKATRVAGGKG